MNDVFWFVILSIDLIIVGLLCFCMLVNFAMFKVDDKSFRFICLLMNVFFFCANALAYYRHDQASQYMLLTDEILYNTIADRIMMLITASTMFLLAIKYKYNWYE